MRALHGRGLRSRQRHELASQVANAAGSGFIWIPPGRKQLRGRAAVKQRPLAVEPSPDTDVVVGAGKTANHEREKMEAGSDRIGRGSFTGLIALKARGRYITQRREVVHVTESA